MEEKNYYLPAGTLLQEGKYRIDRYINSGGFGCTYVATHVMLENRVAIKEFFPKDLCNRDETTSRISVGVTNRKKDVEKLLRKFVDEAKALCKLQHPGIVHVSDVFEENGTAYYVMDYIDGPSLNDLVKRHGPLSEARALYYIRQVCSALAYVHDHNRLHLDLKPGNIMVDGQDHAVLIDFGTSKQYDSESGENTSTMLGLTPGFAPPEQSSRDVRKFLPATDLYALGATLYKLLTGANPLSSVVRSSGEDLAPLPGSVSAATRAAVKAAMEMNKMERTQSVAEFLAILDGSDAGEVDVTVVGGGTSASGGHSNPGGGREGDAGNGWNPGGGSGTGGTVVPEPASRPTGRYIGIAVVIAAAIVGLLLLMNYTGGGGGRTTQPVATATDARPSNPTSSPASTGGGTGGGTSASSSQSAALSTPTPAKPKLVQVHGKVTDKTTGKAVSGAIVKAADGSRETTDSKGEYSFVSGVALDTKISVEYDGKTWITRSVTQAGAMNFKLPLPVKEEPSVTMSVSSNQDSRPTSSSSSTTSGGSVSSHGKINGHEYVDLGLSVKWATCNVGASSASDYGNYYAWGETRPKSDYSNSTSETYGKSIGDIGGTSRDAARANWGGSWRLPTKKELEELKDKCNWTWTTQNGKNGYEVTGPNGKSIFLPAAGWRGGTSLYFAGERGLYWSSTPDESDTGYAFSLRFYSGDRSVGWNDRYFGFSVRPVSE